MNAKLIAFSGIVTAVVGTGIGIAIAHLFPCPYTSQIYKDLDRKYAIVGAVAGLLIGSSQEMIRELKQERDEEEDLLQDLDKAVRSSRGDLNEIPRRRDLPE
ncbi:MULTISPECIES: hypothetical protein [Nostocales]|uniref:Gas vesicle protein n=2 Tax=Nostocales TaxID=1161 RepID=A0ABW8X244_9CYAN|nr:hypothetical protein [Tolypothrix bouteillei]